MQVVAGAFQVYLDTVTRKMKMCACALVYLNIASGWTPKYSDTFNTSMQP